MMIRSPSQWILPMNGDMECLATPLGKPIHSVYIEHVDVPFSAGLTLTAEQMDALVEAWADMKAKAEAPTKAREENATR